MNRLNVGCGGRPNDRACWFGDIRIDIERFPPVMILMDAHALGFPSDTFDEIVCFEVLEHMNFPLRALQEFHRILKVNGRIIITIPNVWYWRGLISTLRDSTKILEENPHKDHRYAWTIYEFCGLAAQCGFKVLDVKWFDWYPKGKLKTRFLEPLLRMIPQIAFMHVRFILRKRDEYE